MVADLGTYCGDWRTDVDTALTEHPSTAVVVALANDAAERRIGETTIPFGSDEHRRLVASFLDELRAIAQRRGADLVLLALPPRVGISAQSLDEGGRRERTMRTILQDYAGTRPGVRTLDLFEQICPAGDCDRPAAGFDPSWRYDGMHYTLDGARWVAGWLSRQLVEVGSPAP